MANSLIKGLGGANYLLLGMGAAAPIVLPRLTPPLLAAVRVSQTTAVLRVSHTTATLRGS